MSAAAGEIIKNAIKKGAAYDLGASFGVGKKIVGRQWKKAATRSGRSAMLANAAVGAVGGGLYGYTQGDWKGGAMMGGATGAGYWMAGGRRGMGLMARKGGFVQKSTAKAIEKKAAGQAVGQQVSSQVTAPTAQRSGFLQRMRQNYWARQDKKAAAAHISEVDRINRRAGILMAEELGAHNTAMYASREARRVDSRALNHMLNEESVVRSPGAIASRQTQKRSRKLRGRRG